MAIKIPRNDESRSRPIPKNLRPVAIESSVEIQPTGTCSHEILEWDWTIDIVKFNDGSYLIIPDEYDDCFVCRDGRVYKDKGATARNEFYDDEDEDVVAAKLGSIKKDEVKKIAAIFEDACIVHRGRGGCRRRSSNNWIEVETS
jgi:hypothetical protein